MPSENPHLVPQLLAGAVVVVILLLAATIELAGGVRAAGTASAAAGGDSRTERGLALTASVVVGATESDLASTTQQMMDGRHDTALREDWEPFFTNLDAAVERADATHDVAMQASAIADLAMTCGQCHRASHAQIASPSPSPRPDDALHVHVWATEQLWVGLSEPNEQAWRRGVEALAGDPVVGSTMLPVSAPIAAASERARYFGRVLSACGDCHAEAHRDALDVFAHIGR